jgi:hypothetical protein
MRVRQQLQHTLITDIVVDIDGAVRDVVLTIHWKGRRKNWFDGQVDLDPARLQAPTRSSST